MRVADERSWASDKWDVTLGLADGQLVGNTLSMTSRKPAWPV